MPKQLPNSELIFVSVRLGGTGFSLRKQEIGCCSFTFKNMHSCFTSLSTSILILFCFTYSHYCLKELQKLFVMVNQFTVFCRLTGT